MEINNALAKWAERTTVFYNEVAARLGDDAPAFYTQSPLQNMMTSPKVLIIGINPGSGGSYKEQCNNNSWGLHGNLMNGSHLMKGNPFWPEHHKWLFWKRLRQLFDERNNPLDDENAYVITNASFFATFKAKELNKDVLMKTIRCSLELIDILKPQFIIVLSGKSLLRTMSEVDKEIHYTRLFNSYSNVVVGNIHGVPCCGVPHPSASLLREERTLIKKVVTQVYNKEEFVKGDYESLLNIINERKNNSAHSDNVIYDLYKAIIAHDFAPYVCYEKHDKFRRYDLQNGLQLTIACNSSTKAIAIRPKDYKGEKDIDKMPIPHIGEIFNCLEEVGYIGDPHWLAVKSLNRLLFDDVNIEADRIEKEVLETVGKINQILYRQQ